MLQDQWAALDRDLRNHDGNSITEPHVTSPRAARSRKALFAPWLAPRSSTWGTTAPQLERPAQRSLNQGHSQKSRAELSRAIAPPRVISASPRHREIRTFNSVQARTAIGPVRTKAKRV